MDIKVGDDVEVISLNHFSKSEKDVFSISIGDKGKVLGFHKRYKVFAIIENEKFKNSKAGEGKLFIPESHLKKIEKYKFDYETSNRKKLHEHIKASGHTSSELGEVLGNKWHFSNITKPSRMKRGDISSEDLLHLSSVVDACGWQIEAIENTKDCNKDQFSSDEFDFKFDTPEEKSQDASVFEGNYQFDTDTRKSSDTGASKSNWMMLNKIAFTICFIMVILLISILYFVVSK